MHSLPAPLCHDQFNLAVGNGRSGDDAPILFVDEPFQTGDEPRVRSALDALHLRGRLHFADGSWEDFVPQLPARIGERVYPPASGAENGGRE